MSFDSGQARPVLVALYASLDASPSGVLERWQVDDALRADYDDEEIEHLLVLLRRTGYIGGAMTVEVRPRVYTVEASEKGLQLLRGWRGPESLASSPRRGTQVR
jgi:hypothetical protein